MNYLILNQLGTPKSFSTKDVGCYLAEFLMDENVIPLKRPMRDILVKIGIVPLRSAKSAKKYQSIWTDQGSPLLVNTVNLQKKLQQRLGGDWKVIVGMRYSTPSLPEALKQVSEESKDRVFFLPLYPHYAQATVFSSTQKLKTLTKKFQKPIRIIEPFYAKPWFNKAQSELIRQNLKPGYHLLLSYHGLPISQETHNNISYQKQCLETSKTIQQILTLTAEQISSSFQSRVGLKKWIGPSTEETMQALVEKGVTSLAVACPSFVADCLETLEEIGMELRKSFLEKGGRNFQLIPCLNDHDLFVEGLVEELCPTQKS